MHENYRPLGCDAVSLRQISANVLGKLSVFIIRTEEYAAQKE
jgi:hypothetical protein